MMTRRQCLKYVALAGTSLTLQTRQLADGESTELITRAIPSSGERLPIVGLGGAASFSKLARSQDVSVLREVMRALFDSGGRVFDTAPSYGESERVAGQIVQQLEAIDKVFWATKLNVAGHGTRAIPFAAREQIARSFQRIGKKKIDLIQVHNLADIPTQLGILKDLRAEGRVRYIGVTSTQQSRYPDLARVMRHQPIDFIGVDYAVDNRESARRILPLARDRGIGVLIYLPFGRHRLWRRVAGQQLPAWAAAFGAHTWAQFFIKYIAAHPAVTAVTPATSKVRNMLDNMAAATGPLPDEAMRRRMEQLIEAMPSA